MVNSTLPPLIKAGKNPGVNLVLAPAGAAGATGAADADLRHGSLGLADVTAMTWACARNSGPDSRRLLVEP